MISNANNTEITLTPNRSLTSRQTQWVVFGVCTIVFIIALFWSIQGAFLVLPFAGLDIILFAYFMFKVNQESLRKQLITIDSQNILIQSGKKEIEEAITFNRFDSFVLVTKLQDKKPFGLKISDSKSFCELGSFLTHSDKLKTREALKVAGLREKKQ